MVARSAPRKRRERCHGNRSRRECQARRRPPSWKDVRVQQATICINVELALRLVPFRAKTLRSCETNPTLPSIGCVSNNKFHASRQKRHTLFMQSSWSFASFASFALCLATRSTSAMTTPSSPSFDTQPPNTSESLRRNRPRHTFLAYHVHLYHLAWRTLRCVRSMVQSSFDSAQIHFS